MSWSFQPLLPASAQLLAATVVTKTVTVSAVLTWAGQQVAPTADVTDGSWLNEAGSNVNLFASVDESPPNDADYIHSTTTSSQCELHLGTIVQPQSGTVTIYVRAKTN